MKLDKIGIAVALIRFIETLYVYFGLIAFQHYRLYVISRCSQLINFDMSTVTAAERETAAVLTTKTEAPPTSSRNPKKSK